MTVKKTSIRVTITLPRVVYKRCEKISTRKGLRPATWLSRQILSILDPEESTQAANIALSIRRDNA